MNDSVCLSKQDSRAQYQQAVVAEPDSRWISTMAALRESGVAPDLDVTLLSKFIDQCISQPPEPFAVAELLTRYFHQEGFPSPGLRRRRQARYVAYEEGEEITARKIVQRIGFAARELIGLTLIDDDSKSSLILRSGDAWTPIDGRELYLDLSNVDGQTHSNRLVTVSGLVAATNRVLFHKQFRYRFVPIMTPETLETYVGISAPGIGILDAAGILEMTGNELSRFTCWSESVYNCGLSSVV